MPSATRINFPSIRGKANPRASWHHRSSAVGCPCPRQITSLVIPSGLQLKNSIKSQPAQTSPPLHSMVGAGWRERPGAGASLSATAWRFGLMDCFFPLFLVRVAIPKHGGCSTSVGAPSWQGNREGERKSPGKSLRQHHRPPWVSIAAFTLECKGSTELSSLPAAGIGLQPWLAPGSEGHLVPACAAGEERSVPTWSGGEVQGHTSCPPPGR